MFLDLCNHRQSGGLSVWLGFSLTLSPSLLSLPLFLPFVMEKPPGPLTGEDLGPGLAVQFTEQAHVGWRSRGGRLATEPRGTCTASSEEPREATPRDGGRPPKAGGPQPPAWWRDLNGAVRPQSQQRASGWIAPRAAPPLCIWSS